MLVKKVARRNKIRNRIRKKVTGTAQRPRLSVYRSNKDIYVQLVDDVNGHTLVAASSREKELSGNKGAKMEKSKLVGQKLAERAREAGIENVVFDRGGYLYHGRVKALAEGARESGLNF